jgi:hypothetical protein
VAVTADAQGRGESLSGVLRRSILQEPSPPGAKDTSSLPVLASDGRADIWRVAVQEFRGAPLLGVGADNFVFRYDRSRAVAEHSPKQAHSLELQILGETGILGGVFAFGSILLAAGGILWPRLSVGWRATRKAWSQRRERRLPTESSTTSAPDDQTPGDPLSLSYGWQMALLAGCAYWLVQARVDWLWQMAGVTLPAFLMLAAALTAPSRRLALSWSRSRCRIEVGKTLPDRRPTVHRLWPSVFRASLLTLSLLVFVFTCFPYISSMFQDSALTLADQDAPRAVRRAVAVHWLTPGDPKPLETQTYIYAKTAEQALTTNSVYRAEAVLDALALRLGSCERAVALEPADWSTHRAAGVAALDLYLAVGYAEGWMPAFGPDVLPVSPAGASDWSALSVLSQPIPGASYDPGIWGERTRAKVQHYRVMTPEELAFVSLRFLQAAKERNPLASQIDLDLQLLHKVAPCTAAGAP